MMFSGPRLVGIIYKHQQQKFPVIKKEGEKEIIARAEKRERRRRRSTYGRSYNASIKGVGGLG